MIYWPRVPERRRILPVQTGQQSTMRTKWELLTMLIGQQCLKDADLVEATATTTLVNMADNS